MAGSMKGQAAQTPQHLQRVAQQLMATQKARHSASKYDFVKVCMPPPGHTGGDCIDRPVDELNTFRTDCMPHYVLPGEGMGGRELGTLLRPLAFSHQSHAYSH